MKTKTIATKNRLIVQRSGTISTAVIIGSLFLLGLFAYLNTFGAGFQLDDYSNILNAKSVAE